MDRIPMKSNFIQQKIAEKRSELESLNEIKKFTSILTGQLENLESKLNDMAEGTESVALVLSNWQNVVNSISLASLGLLKYSQKDYETGTPLPEYLVRIPLDKDDNSNGQDQQDEAYTQEEVDDEGDLEHQQQEVEEEEEYSDQDD
ncbi:DASH complex subunit Dad2p [[Candida] anglica]|uniref:DASH complex subunit DAD2 n=1 Tax=[Candida] anglica TaxID=148631 RepID=A0ABP0EF14_9ASCO